MSVLALWQEANLEAPAEKKIQLCPLKFLESPELGCAEQLVETVDVLSIQANALQSKSALYVSSSSENDGPRSLVKFESSATTANGAGVLHLVQSTALQTSALANRPSSALAIESAASESIFVHVAHSSAAEGAQVTLARSRLSAPTAALDANEVSAGDNLGRIRFRQQLQRTSSWCLS